MALAAFPSSAVACPINANIDLWFFSAQAIAVAPLFLASVWVGGRKVWLGCLLFVALNLAAAYVYARFGTYPVAFADKRSILTDSCGGPTANSLPAFAATWALLTLGLCSALKPLLRNFTPTIPHLRIATSVKWVAVVAVLVLYGVLLISMLRRLFFIGM